MSVQVLKYCRFCAESKHLHELINLSSLPKVGEEIYEKLSFFNVNLIDFSLPNLPETICTACHTALNDSYQFFTKIKISQVVLANLVSSDLNCDFNLEDSSNHSYEYCNTHIEVLMEPTDSKSGLCQKIDESKRNLISGSPSTTKENLLNITDGDSWTLYPWICKHCGASLSSMKALIDHSCNVHKTCFGYRCADCDASILNFEDFIRHVGGHREILKLRCQYCDHHSETSDDNTTHIQQHTGHRCQMCGEIFKNVMDLRDHKTDYNPPKMKKKVRNKGIPATVEGLTCKICFKTMKSPSSMYAHRKLHTNRQRDFYCDRCPKSFFTKGQLKTHTILHNKPEPQICKICQKSFLTLPRLKIHLDSHYEVKRFQCDVCKRFFRLKGMLKDHLITHTDLMPYSCECCGRRFKFKSALKNHEVVHTGARPFSCEDCTMTFTTWSNCNKHMLKHHGREFDKRAKRVDSA